MLTETSSLLLRNIEGFGFLRCYRVSNKSLRARFRTVDFLAQTSSVASKSLDCVSILNYARRQIPVELE